MGYRTLWLDNESDLRGVDFSNTLFLTEGQVDGRIPLRNDCYYILHNCSASKYSAISTQNQIKIQVYTDDILLVPDAIKMDTCIYYHLSDQCLYMPWATDLLPSEIDKVKEGIQDVSMENCVYWIGTVGEGEFGNLNELTPFIQACEESGIKFVQQTHVSVELNKQLTQKSYIAPTIVGRWQSQKGYIPCRVFKNISYGKMGVTNSKRVYELFEGKIVFNSDTYQLFFDAEQAMESMTLNQLYELMDLVKEKHTYINRIHTMLDFFELINPNVSNKS